MKILIVTGGYSSEREISLLSAKNIAEVIKNIGYKTDLYDLKNGLESLKTLSKKYDVLFPILHGEEGEGGKLHKFLTRLNRPLVGSRNYKGFTKGWYKISFKRFCDKNKILTARWKPIENGKAIEEFGFPCVVKRSLVG